MHSETAFEAGLYDGETEGVSFAGPVSEGSVIASLFISGNQQSAAETILLVEDEAFVRRVAAEVLASAGYRVVVAESTSEALAVCRQWPETIDLLLADIVMPVMNGRELAAEFEKTCPSAKVLLMSGYPEQLALCELPAYRAQFLAKPFSVRAFLQRVREVLDMKLDVKVVKHA